MRRLSRLALLETSEGVELAQGVRRYSGHIGLLHLPCSRNWEERTQDASELSAQQHQAGV